MIAFNIDLGKLRGFSHDPLAFMTGFVHGYRDGTEKPGDTVDQTLDKDEPPVTLDSNGQILAKEYLRGRRLGVAVLEKRRPMPKWAHPSNGTGGKGKTRCQ
jgi:hypothetical protein